MRKYFTLAAVVSFVLLVALVVMWVGSYGARTAYEFWRADGLWEAVSETGRVRLDNAPRRRLYFDTPVARLGRRDADLLVLVNALFHRSEDRNRSPAERAAASEEVYRLEQLRRELSLQMSLAISSGGRPTRRPGWTVGATTPPPPLASHSVPYPAPVTAAAVLPLAWVASFLVRRRRRKVRLLTGLCVRCGYDLRASGRRCSECGSVSTRASEPVLPPAPAAR